MSLFMPGEMPSLPLPELARFRADGRRQVGVVVPSSRSEFLSSSSAVSALVITRELGSLTEMIVLELEFFRLQ